MQHRDKVIIQKIISEIDIGVEVMGNEKMNFFCG